MEAAPHGGPDLEALESTSNPELHTWGDPAKSSLPGEGAMKRPLHHPTASSISPWTQNGYIKGRGGSITHDDKRAGAAEKSAVEETDHVVYYLNAKISFHPPSWKRGEVPWAQLGIIAQHFEKAMGTGHL